MYRKHAKIKLTLTGGIVFLLAVSGILVFFTPAVHGGQEVIYFSTEESFTATAGPHAGQVISHGDLLSNTGQVIARNAHLMRNFQIMPLLPDTGLDGVYLRSSGEILFSIEDTYWDEGLGTWLGHGDLLSDSGVIVQTNPQLLQNFGPMPVLGDFGLDAIHELGNQEVEFSIEDTFWDEVLAAYVRHGDLLSDSGSIVKTNAQLLANFGPMPTPTDYGLDAVHRPGSGEIWFSIEDTFWDEVLGQSIGHGDLLSDNGSIVKTNAQLLAAFFGGADNVTRDYGLDAVWVVPEPASLALLLVAGLAVLRGRRVLI